MTQDECSVSKPRWATTDATVTIVPRLFAAKTPSALRQMLNVPLRLTSITASKSASDTGGSAMAALTVPYAERIDRKRSKPIPEIEKMLAVAAGSLSARIGGKRHPA